MNKNILIADIGGTNARFALAGKGSESLDEKFGFTLRQTLQCADYQNVEAAVDAYLLENEIQHLDGICFAAAGPILDGRLKMTNNHWLLDSGALRNHFGLEHVKLLNDWESISYSLPQLKHGDLLPIGKDWMPQESGKYVLGALGPGSGLGVGGICVDSDQLFPLNTEGGHVGFAPETSIQVEVLKVLQSEFDRVSIERLLSGPGLVNIYRSLNQIEGRESKGLSAAEIADRSTTNTDEVARKALELFFEILGQAAGDLALTLGASAIYIGGGICQRYPDALQNSSFRMGFERKGRHSKLLEKIPTWLIQHQDPGLLGADVYAQTKLCGE